MDSCLTLFLGGTCGDSNWRDDIIPLLEHEKLSYFNPVVSDWDNAAQENERLIKESPLTVELYFITSDMLGVFSIAEVADSSNKKPNKTILYIQRNGFDVGQLKSLDAVADLVTNNNAYVSTSMFDIVMHFKSIELAYRAKRISVLARKKILSWNP